MGKTKDITNEKKIRIEALLKTGLYSHRRIATMERVSRQTVDRIAKLIKENLPSTSGGRNRCRGVRKTTERDDRKIIKIALENRQASSRELLDKLKLYKINISELTLRSRLYAAGIRCRRPAKKPRLTAKMKKARLQWAKMHSKFTVEDWKKVIFSDESRLEAMTESVRFVRRRPNERYSEEAVQKKIKHPPSIMIWSCITAAGTGPLYFVEGTMNQFQYKKVIETVLVPFLNSLDEEEGPYTFMQDGAPCHRAKSVRNVFETHNIPLLPWPGNSPDLNPIENVWSALKNLTYSSANPTVTILKENISRNWRESAKLQEVVKACINSMPDRIKAVIKAKGALTKY